MSLDISNLKRPAGKRRPRNWPEYNERLVQRGEISFYFNTLASWDEELKAMNQGKRGRPFRYRRRLIFIAKLLRFQFTIAYRSLEGIFRSIGQWMGFKVPDFSTLFARLDKIDLRKYLPQSPSLRI